MPVIALAAVDVVVIALAGALLLYASAPIWKPLLVGALSQLPLVGSWAASNVAWLLTKIYLQTTAWGTAAVGPLTAAVRGVADAGHFMLQAVLDYESRVTFAILRIRQSIIPAAIAQAADYTARRYTDAVNFTTHQVALARSAATAALHAAEAELGARIVAAIAYTGAALAAAYAYTQQSFAAAVGYAGALALQAQAALAHAQAQLIALVGTQFAVAIGLQRAGDAALGNQIANAEAEAKTYARALSLDNALATERALALALASVGTLAAVEAADIAAIRAMRCLQRCAELAAVGDAVGLLDIAVIFALVEAARTDPKGLENFLAAELRPLALGMMPNL